MKLLTAIAIVLSSSVVFAMPTVGDYAQFNVQITQGTQTAKGTYELELTSFDAINAAYKQKTTITQNGAAQSDEQWVPKENLLDDESVNQIMVNCTSGGGSLQKVTVAAGTFDACAVPVGNGDTTGTMWIASGVPFGLVKQDVTAHGGLAISLELQSFHPGVQQ